MSIFRKDRVQAVNIGYLGEKKGGMGSREIIHFSLFISVLCDLRWNTCIDFVISFLNSPNDVIKDWEFSAAQLSVSARRMGKLWHKEVSVSHKLQRNQ